MARTDREKEALHRETLFNVQEYKEGTLGQEVDWSEISFMSAQPTRDSTFGDKEGDTGQDGSS